MRAVRAKARIGADWRPSLKAGVNERLFVDDAVSLVSKYFGHYSVFRPGFLVDILKSVRSVFRVFRGFNGF